MVDSSSQDVLKSVVKRFVKDLFNSVQVRSTFYPHLDLPDFVRYLIMLDWRIIRLRF